MESIYARYPIPPAMKALELHSYDGSAALTLASRPTPRPGVGEVLVRMAAAPINPSDLMFLRGLYGVRRELPAVPGFEGSGLVVAAGKGVYARSLVGRRVACGATGGAGTWAEYMVTAATACIPLLPHISYMGGATLIVNPLSALAMLDIARRGGHRAIVHTAAASALGQMLARLSHTRGPLIIHIVRRAAQAEMLRDLGMAYVLNSSAPDFDDRLATCCAELGATLAFDAVAGEMTGRLARAMPPGSNVLVYGALSEDLCRVNPYDHVFRRQRIGGFWLTDWLARQSFLKLALLGFQAQTALLGDLSVRIQARLPLVRALDAITQYERHMTDGKVLLIPWVGGP